MTETPRLPTTTKGWERALRAAGLGTNIPADVANRMASDLGLPFRTEVERSRHDLARAFASHSTN